MSKRPTVSGQKKKAAAIKAAYVRKAVTGVGAYRPRVIKGRGDYKAKVAKNAYYKGYGSRLGSVLGEGAERLWDRINPLKVLGLGDYIHAPWEASIKSNSLLGMGLDPPEVVNSNFGNMILRHREYIGDVITGSAGVFNNTGFNLNPGIQATFPWLSQVAVNFEQYKWRGLIFEFKSTSAEALNSTNTALGQVIMATAYDATRPLFASKQQMENHQYAMSAKQSCSMLHPIECDPSQSTLQQLYVRNQGSADDDLRFTDFGIFQIATNGQQASSVNVGELWVTYEVELLKPRWLTPEGSASVLTDKYNFSGTITTSNYWGTASVYGGNLGVAIPVGGGTTLTFPSTVTSGYFLLIYACYGSSSAVVSPTITATSNCSLVSAFNNNTQNAIGDGGTDTTLMTACLLNINGPSAVVTFSGGTLPTSPTRADLIITSYNPLAYPLPEEKEEKEEKSSPPSELSDSAALIAAKLRELGVSPTPGMEKEYRLIYNLAKKL